MRMNRLTQRFDDRAIEREYRATRALELLPGVRAATALAGVLWAMAGPVARALETTRHPELGWVFYAFMVPVHVLVVAATFTTLGRNYPERLAAGLNTLSGFAMLITMSLLGRPDLSFALIMVQVVFACIALRLPFLLAFAVTVPQLTGWAVLEGSDDFAGSGIARAFLLFTVHVASLLGAYNLERSDRRGFLQDRVIREQAKSIEEEQRKSERLLLNVLPGPIAARLKENQGSIADGFADVTVLFSDLVGFTQLAARMSPEELVALLNDIFTKFDELAQKHGLEKIKTIGDAYMVVGGLPLPRKDHAEAVARMGLDMIRVVDEFVRESGEPLQVRIGINTGPVVAGVIGKTKFTYDLWGDAVNIASRMESHGVPGTVHVSDSTHERLEKTFRFEPRGTITVKGKGEMRTWLLLGPAA